MAKSVFTAEYAKFLITLKKARIEAGLTQGDTARLLGKPQSFVSKCESGERRVDIVELAAFARIYRQKVDYFIPNIKLRFQK